MNVTSISILLAAAVAAAQLDPAAMTMQQRVAAAAENSAKIAEVAPASPSEKAKFKAELLKAVGAMPASPAEKEKKKAEVLQALGHDQAPASAPIVFTCALLLELQQPTNTTDYAELEMGYGLDRKPRTMDKTKKYYPGRARGVGAPLVDEPRGYSCQTVR